MTRPTPKARTSCRHYERLGYCLKFGASCDPSTCGGFPKTPPMEMTPELKAAFDRAALDQAKRGLTR